MCNPQQISSEIHLSVVVFFSTRRRQLIGLGQPDFGDGEGASAINVYPIPQISAHTWNVCFLEALLGGSDEIAAEVE